MNETEYEYRAQNRDSSFFHLPSFCPSPLKALNRSLGFTYSCSWWSSISKLTWPPWTSRCSSTGISLNYKNKNFPITSWTAKRNYPKSTHTVWVNSNIMFTLKVTFNYFMNLFHPKRRKKKSVNWQSEHTDSWITEWARKKMWIQKLL